MTVLELKRQAGLLKARDLQELHVHVLLLRRHTSEWRRSTARKLAAVEKGRFVTAEQLEKKMRK